MIMNYTNDKEDEEALKKKKREMDWGMNDFLLL